MLANTKMDPLHHPPTCVSSVLSADWPTPKFYGGGGKIFPENRHLFDMGSGHNKLVVATRFLRKRVEDSRPSIMRPR